MMQSAPAMYSDFQALGSLKKDARENSPEAIKQVAKQFESLFVQMMLKSMRDTVPENKLFGSNSGKMYQEMYDKQLSVNIASGKGIGLANTIERQLGGVPEYEQNDKKVAEYLANSRPVNSLKNSNVTVFGLRRVSMDTATDLPAVNAEKSQPGTWNSAKDFIDDIWPHALRAAEVLGVDADVLVAQSALETGWGKYIPRQADGSSSFNLFGIKADQRWSGDRVEISTREYRHGVMQVEQAEFRSYQSAGEAFDNYTQFILENPRYRKALEHGYDPQAYSTELQKAGYATDPDYANKINRIRNDDALQSRVSELKNLQKVPLT